MRIFIKNARSIELFNNSLFMIIQSKSKSDYIIEFFVNFDTYEFVINKIFN